MLSSRLGRLGQDRSLFRTTSPRSLYRPCALRVTLIPLSEAAKGPPEAPQAEEFEPCSQSFKSGGRQVKVGAGRGRSPSIAFEAEPGDEVTIDQVLFLEKDGGEVLAGAPFVADVKVVGVVDGESRGPKIRVFKKKRRKGMRRTKGHRSTYTRIRIKDIVV